MQNKTFCDKLSKKIANYKKYFDISRQPRRGRKISIKLFSKKL